MNTQSKIATAEGFDERVVYEACPLCASTQIQEVRRVDCSRHPSWVPPLSTEMAWMSCDACNHSFTDGYFTPEALELVFDKVQTNQNPGDNLEKNRQVSADMIGNVLPYRDAGVWLDVGFGNGSLLFTAEEFGFDVVGLDLRQSSVDQMTALGFRAKCCDICDLAEDGSYAVISMADVLEHTPFPKDVLNAAHRLLDSDGVLFLSMPNADAFLWRHMTAQNINPFWAELEHYHNFGRSRLYALLGECGFAPRRYGVSARYRCCMEIIATKR